MLRRNGPAAFAVAILLVAMALGIRVAAGDGFRSYPFLTTYPAAVIAALVGGLGPGLLALALGGLGSWILLISPGSLTGGTPSDVIGLSVFLAVTGLTAWM